MVSYYVPTSALVVAPVLGQLGSRERRILIALDQSLRDHSGFQDAFPKAVLVLAFLEHMDSVRPNAEAMLGCYRLWYRYGDSLAEFWGQLGSRREVNLEDGLVYVREQDVA